MSRQPATRAEPPVIRARNAVWLSFFVMGMVSMAWVPRIPEIKHHLGLTNGQFGLVLLASTVGAVPGAQLAGRAIHRFGSRPVAVVTGVGMPAGLFIMAVSSSVWQLVIGLFVLGFSNSALDIACNTQAVAIERLASRRYMSSFHGMWSVGSFMATVFGGVVAEHVSPQRNLEVISVASLAVFAFAISRMLPSRDDGHKGHDGEPTEAKVALFGARSLVLWGLGIGLVGALIPETSAADWSGILLRDHMGIGTGVTASAFAAFTLAMIVSRMSGDAVMMRWGAERTVRIGGYVGGIAMGAAVAVGVPLSSASQPLALVVVCVGFAIAGLGIGPMFPAYMSAAGQVPGVAPSVGMARIGLIALAGYFGGPSITGGLAELVSLPVAMAFPAALLVMAGWQSRYIGRTGSAGQALPVGGSVAPLREGNL